MSDAREERWQSEKDFFGAEASKIAGSVKPIDPCALARYGARRLRSAFYREHEFRLLGRLAGKHVLDVGCGSGGNAVLMVKLGALVTGIDVSPAAVRVAEERARVNGVSASTRFVCAPLELAALPERASDIIWCNDVLHHVIPELDLVMNVIVKWAKPGALLIVTEPVTLSRCLRRLRLLLPISTEATPGERPLEPAELAILRRRVPGLRTRHYSLFGRLDRFVLTNHNYERSSAWRRMTSWLLAHVDYALLTLPGVRRLGARVIMYGRIGR
jgi:SAM-dependent methyltransferase